jgi:hypothetical protein
MSSGAGDTTQLVPGYPIRTPWDHSSVDSSPRPIAASHVLHRLLVPRHPPSALDNLTTKMLASTVQFSTNDQPTTPPPPPAPNTTNAHQRRPRLPERYESQAMPGPEKTNPAPGTRPRTACSFRTQQGAHHQPQPHPPPSFPRRRTPPHTNRRGANARRVPDPVGRCQRRLASVSAHEHPHPTQSGWRAPPRPSAGGAP